MVASGAAGLAYEIVYTRTLGLFLGHHAGAALAVLAVFMGGLAAGGAHFGKRADRGSRESLTLYVALEAGIGLYALAFPWVSASVRAAFLRISAGWPSDSPALACIRFVAAGAVILPPTLMMGGSLPALARFATIELGQLQARVAALYAANSAGAVLGCLAAEFALIPAFGIPATSSTGAALNLLAAGAAAGLARALPGLPSPPTGGPPATAPSGRRPGDTLPATARLALAAIALSGFAGMVYEVADMRLLALSLGSTTHAFALMVSCFIAGITAGAWMVAAGPRWAAAPAALAGAQFGLGALVLAMLPLYGLLPYLFPQAERWLAPDIRAYPAAACLQGLLSLAVLFPPALLLGAAVPLAAKAACPSQARTGAALGRVMALNTLGAVGGALVAGLWCMPVLGLARTLGVGVAANGLAGALALRAARPRGGFLPLAAGLAGCVALPWLCGWAFDARWRQCLTLGIWRAPGSVESYAEFRGITRENRLEYYRDGVVATVSVNTWGQGAEEQLNLRVNGKPDASTAGDMPTQLLLGHLPMLLRPRSSRALVVGLGGGVTAAAVARHPSLTNVDAVEISPEVAAAARLFAPWNHRILEDPRFHLSIEDAGSFVRRSTARYDVIVSEPSNPWIAGVAGLFTLEFYQACRARLAPDGLMVQWVHLYDNQQAALDVVLRTLAEVFPSVSVWRSQELDLILVASAQPQVPDLDGFLAECAAPGVTADLAKIALDRPAALLARELVEPGTGRFLAEPEGPVETESHPRLEYLAQPAFFAHRRASDWLDTADDLSPRAKTLLAAYLHHRALTSEDYRGLARSHLEYGLPGTNLLQSLRLRWQSDPTASASHLALLPRLPPLGTPEELEALRLNGLRAEILAHPEERPDLARHYLRLLTQVYRSQRSAFYLPPALELRSAAERLFETLPAERSAVQLLLAELAWDRGDAAECVKFGRSALASTDWSTRSGDTEFKAAVARHIEALMETQAPAEAREVALEAFRRRLTSPRLDYVRRKATR